MTAPGGVNAADLNAGDISAADAPRIGVLSSGPRDTLCDVRGVTVGHATLDRGAVQTGVTVVFPHGGDPFRDKVPAAATVLNGFGKSVGLVQLEELGVLETPIALTNTFAVGAVVQAQIRQAVGANPAIGRGWPTVNPLVFECNDGYLNDIQAMVVSQDDYLAACRSASADFVQGAVGAGRGMSAFSFKGGIGSASRLARPGRSACGPGLGPCATTQCGPWTVGALVLANFGRRPLFTVAGRPFGRWLAQAAATDAPANALASAAVAGAARAADDVHTEAEKGSIILLLATDAPLDSRQLRRLSMRAGAGLARTGSVFGHGSGDIALAFSTAYTVPHLPERAMPGGQMLHEMQLDPLFEAAAEAIEQAIVHALWHARTVTGRDGHVRLAVREAIPQWRQWLARGA